MCMYLFVQNPFQYPEAGAAGVDSGAVASLAQGPIALVEARLPEPPEFVQVNHIHLVLL